MIHAVSPYELLLAAKPRQMTYSSDYDLYSSSRSAVGHDDNTPVDNENLSAGFPEAGKPASQKRTHYITDIHAKHHSANQQTIYAQTNMI